MAKQTKSGGGRGKRGSPTKRSARAPSTRVPDEGGESKKSRFGVSDEELHNMTELQLEKFALALGIDDALSMDKADLMREVEARNNEDRKD